VSCSLENHETYLPLMKVLETRPEEEFLEIPPDQRGGASERGPEAP